MYDTGDEIWELLTDIFPQLMDQHRELVDLMVDRSVTYEERRAARDLLTNVLGVDPMFEVDWARNVAENPDLELNRDDNRRLLFDGYFNKFIDKEQRVDAREEFTEALGRDPLEDDAPMHDWES
jgi:hypothetical protein